MTILVDEIADTLACFVDSPCECGRPSHHPGQCECRQAPVYMAVIEHVRGCDDRRTVALCQDCLDEALEWANGFIGSSCATCGVVPTKVSDLVGPVVAL